MTTLVWYVEVGGAYLAASFALAVVIGRCLRGNSAEYPVIDEYMAPLPAEMAAFEPDDCVPVDSRSRIRPVNFANLRRKQAVAAAESVSKMPAERAAPQAVRSVEAV